SNENCKVEEVLFINKLNVEDFKVTLQMRLSEVEKKIQGGRRRRQQHLTGIAAKQRKRAREKAMQLSDR
ncbi:unnamed protein product, partial [Chrysoparadoxa australica]